MVTRTRSRTKTMLVDGLGILLIIAAALTGWLPGPGGIPLLILGLSLLATNHEWAERWLNIVKSNGNKFSEKFFNGHPVLRLIIDAIGIMLVAGAVLLLVHFTASVARSAAISLFAVAIFLLLGNRNRFTNLKQKLKSKNHKH